MNDLLKQKMDEVPNLTEQERRVLISRFGLEDGNQRTLEELGQELGVTRERIRQIEAGALRKLRHPNSHIRYLHPIRVVLVLLVLLLLSMLARAWTRFLFWH